MSDTIQIIGNRLRSYRKAQNLSQEELAEKADLHHTYIGQVERGEKNVTVGSLEKICMALHVSFSELFDGLGPSGADDNTPNELVRFLSEEMPDKQAILLNIMQEIRRYNS